MLQNYLSGVFESTISAFKLKKHTNLHWKMGYEYKTKKSFKKSCQITFCCE